MPLSVGCNELWSKCITVLKEKLNDEEFNTWLSPIVPLNFEDNILLVFYA